METEKLNSGSIISEWQSLGSLSGRHISAPDDTDKGIELRKWCVQLVLQNMPVMGFAGADTYNNRAIELTRSVENYVLGKPAEPQQRK